MIRSLARRGLNGALSVFGLEIRAKTTPISKHPIGEVSVETFEAPRAEAQIALKTYLRLIFLKI